MYTCRYLFIHDIRSHDIFFEDWTNVDVTDGNWWLAFFPQKLKGGQGRRGRQGRTREDEGGQGRRGRQGRTREDRQERR